MRNTGSLLRAHAFLYLCFILLLHDPSSAVRPHQVTLSAKSLEMPPDFKLLRSQRTARLMLGPFGLTHDIMLTRMAAPHLTSTLWRAIISCNGSSLILLNQLL